MSVAVEEVEIPKYIRNLDLFNRIKTNRTPNRPKNRELYVDKLLECSAEEINRVLFLNDDASKKFRNKIESLSAQTQCIRTIGKKCVKNYPNTELSPDFDASTDEHCWLCGYKFNCNDSVDCEHLIPITFAGLFTGIKSSKRVNLNEFTDAFIDAYTMNYMYAHASCNRSKSSLMLCKWSSNGMIFDENAGRELQTRISNVAPYYVAGYEDVMLANYRKKMQVICDFINGEYNEFLRQGLSMTDYIKYLISMTQIYLSKTHLKSLKSDKDRRNSLSEIASITEDIEDESSRVFDIVKENEIHTSAKKVPTYTRRNSQLKPVAERLFTRSRSRSKSHVSPKTGSPISRSRSRSMPRSRSRV